MKYIIFCILFSILLCPIITQGQITISPEVGITYSPYTISHGRYSAKKANVIFGISGEIPIHDKWGVSTRISYNKMETANFYQFALLGSELHEYKHENINFDILLFYKITPKINIGIGPSMIKKFNAVYTVKKADLIEPIEEYNYRFNHFGLSAGISYDFRYVKLNLNYMQKFDESYFVGVFGAPYESNYRINLTLAVPIRSGKKRK